jgi:hypothetical protein
MSDRIGWNKERIALSVRVGAMVAVLGFVLLAAEQRLVQDVSPQEIIATDPPAFTVDTAAPPAAKPATATENERAATPPVDYFPSHFPAPTVEDVQQPSTF